MVATEKTRGAMWLGLLIIQGLVLQGDNADDDSESASC